MGRMYHLRLWTGATLLLAMVVVAVFAPLLAPHDPYRQDLMLRMLPPAWSADGEWGYWLGTDTYGRDLLSRLIYGARLSISIALGAMLIALGVGTTLGIVAGYLGGRFEHVIMRLAEAYQAIPDILLAVVIVALFGGSVTVLILVLGLSGWDSYTRLTFNLARSWRERAFIDSAVASGAGRIYVMRRHILPQMIPILTVTATLHVAQIVLQETSLSFLGLGLPPPAATWGNILAEGAQRLLVAPWISNIAGATVVLLVLGITLLGGALRDAVDPKALR